VDESVWPAEQRAAEASRHGIADDEILDLEQW
jgi:hypothetical protein